MSTCKERRPERKSYHWFISVFLELYKAHTSDVLQVVPVLRLKVIVVAVEVREGWWSDSHRFFAVDLVSDHIVCLQQRLKHKKQPHSSVCLCNPKTSSGNLTNEACDYASCYSMSVKQGLLIDVI